MGSTFTRRDVLARAGAGAAFAVGGGSVVGAPAASARAAVPDGDLAYARLLVALELLSLDFYSQALRAGRFPATLELRRARAAEKQHYDAVAAVLTDAGQVPATAQDIDFSYPRGSFGSQRAIARLGVRLETLSLGAYLGAVRALETPEFRNHAARAAASEAQHLSVFSGAVGGRRIGPPLPPALPIDRVSDALDAYAS
ncbi:MAG TPA: ferritin-like domain-containing protein [Gaiellaceae bacterium]|nr:ferritin-like domain-containing protein [Gaiellaceae bacterium]